MRVVTLIEKYIYISRLNGSIQYMLIEMWFMCELNGMEWNELNGNILCTVLYSIHTTSFSVEVDDMILNGNDDMRIRIVHTHMYND